MAEPIRVLVMIKGFTEAWYQLSDAEQESWWDRLQAIGEGVGAKFLVQCDSRWANEEYAFWGVLEYPTLDACKQAIAENEKQGWYRYVVATSLLGTEPSE